MQAIRRHRAEGGGGGEEKKERSEGGGGAIEWKKEYKLEERAKGECGAERKAGEVGGDGKRDKRLCRRGEKNGRREWK